MATRQQLAVWLPVTLAVLVTVGYVESRAGRATDLAPSKELVASVAPGVMAPDSSKIQDALTLAAAANARAEKAEKLILSMKDQLAKGLAAPNEQPARAPSAAEEREAHRAEREAFLHELDERVATEPLDPKFRSEKVAAITNATASLSSHGVSLEKAECASSSCKIRLSHPSQNRLPRGAAMEFLKAAHAPGSALTQLAFNFKYEDGVTTLYGTTATPHEAD